VVKENLVTVSGIYCLVFNITQQVDNVKSPVGTATLTYLVLFHVNLYLYLPITYLLKCKSVL